MSRILIAGIGNIFEGDDGFGCEVAARLRQLSWPEGVDVVDFGIRGIDLGYALMDGYETAILVDAVERGLTPGTVTLIEPQIPQWESEDGRNPDGASHVSGPMSGAEAPLMAAHELNPAQVLRFVASLGGQRPRVLLVGCQPEFLGGEQGHMGLSDVVMEAVAQATTRIRTLVGNLTQQAMPEQSSLVA